MRHLSVYKLAVLVVLLYLSLMMMNPAELYVASLEVVLLVLVGLEVAYTRLPHIERLSRQRARRPRRRPTAVGSLWKQCRFMPPCCACALVCLCHQQALTMCAPQVFSATTYEFLPFYQLVDGSNRAKRFATQVTREDDLLFIIYYIYYY